MNNSSKFLSFFICCVAFFLTLPLLVSCKKEPKPEEILGYYASGELSRRYSTINHKKEGKMIDYYPDGSLKGERLFRNDTQVGKTILYYKSGKIQEVQYFDQGTIHGGDTVFYESGQPQFMVTMDHGVKDGYIRKWAEDGSVIYEAKYARDTLVEVKGVPLNRDSLEIH